MRPGNPLLEKQMDLHNNKFGAELGKFGGTDDQLSQQCMKALTDGKLIHY